MNALPRENVIAAFPPSVKAGNVVLRPLTLGGAIRLAERGISTGARVPKDKLFVAAWILSEGGRCGGSEGCAGSASRTSSTSSTFSTSSTSLRRFLRRAKCGLQQLSNAVEEVLNTAYETYVAPKPENGKQLNELTPSGLGWALELSEWLCAEYGWSWRDALETPVATAYALIAAARARHGGKHGAPDYIERQFLADVKAGKAKLVDIK